MKQLDFVDDGVVAAAKDIVFPTHKQLMSNDKQVGPQAAVPNSKSTKTQTICKITIDDIAEEVHYFENGVVCFVVGANPPSMLLTGSLSRFGKT